MRSVACAVLVLLCVASCCVLGQSGPIVPNQSQIRGTVVLYAILDAEFMGIASHQTLYKLGVFVETAEAVSPYPNLLADSVGSVVEVLSKTELDPCLYGKIVEMEVRVAGDETGQSTWLLAGTLVLTGSDSSVQTPSFCVE